MAYPISALRILRGIPWDNDYVNVRKFTSKTEQQNYMMAHLAYNLGDNFSYIRKEQGEPIRVELSEGDLLNCNYLMFINAEYSDRWFFAFITDVRYIADGTSYIYFEVDEIQTWLFDFQIPACLVEREHTNDDTIGANTVPEGLECGPYVVNSAWTENFGGLAFAFLATQTVNGGHVQRIYNGIYSGLFYSPASTWEGLRDGIQEYIDAGLEDAIVSVFCIPALTLENGPLEPVTKTRTVGKPYSSIDGYTPKNKKLFTYPYNYLILSNNAGVTNEVRYELWPTSDMTFMYWAVGVTMPEAFCCPSNYRGLTYDIDNGVPVNGWPQCAFSGDTFKAWWAQNKDAKLTTAVGSAVSSGISGGLGGSSIGGTIGGVIGSLIAPGVGTAAGAAVGSAVGGALGGIASSLFSSATNALAESQHVAALPDSCRGQAMTPSLMTGIGRMAVTMYAVNIRAEYARRIDDFFSMFGYKTNRIKTPNLDGRSSWNYVKTVGALVEGNVPISAARLLQDMLNRGVTFWHVDDVGNYGLSNPIK